MESSLYSRSGGVRGHFNFSVLQKHIAMINLGEARNLPLQVIKRLALDLKFKRVSIVEYDEATDRIVGITNIGFRLRGRDINLTKLVVSKVTREREPFITDNIEAFPELMSPFAQSYRTPACAVIPLRFQNEVVGVLCLSDLSVYQVEELRQRRIELETIAEQIGQLLFHWQFLKEERGEEYGTRLTERSRYFQLLDDFIESVNTIADTESIVSNFSQLLRECIPFNFWGMIFNPLEKGEEIIVSLAEKASEDDVRWLVERFSQEWPKKSGKSSFSLSDVSIISGEELLVETGSSSIVESASVEFFPIYLDNNLFGLIGVVSPASFNYTDDSRQFVKVMSHHLGMHLKKNYLMVANQELEYQDNLTGLFNQRHFYYLVEREFERSMRYNVPFSILFVDIDHFKDINDTYGFEEGDNILREISRIILDNHRSTDLISRYSGERFVLALPETHLREAEMVANRLRRLIAGHTFYVAPENIFIKVTASIGVASFLDHRPRSVAQFIEFADTALYFAKRNGRNQVVSYTYVINMMMKDSGGHG